MKKYSCLTVAERDHEVDSSYNSFHEFGHAAFVSFMKRKVVKLRIHNIYGGGLCAWRFFRGDEKLRWEESSSSMNLQNLMIDIAGDISTIYFDKIVKPLGSDFDTESFVETYNKEIAISGGIEEMFYHLLEQTSNVDITLSDEQITLINEFIDEHMKFHRPIVVGIKDKKSFREFLFELCVFMFKMISFVEIDLKGMSLLYKDRSFLKSATCESITNLFTKAFNKVKTSYDLSFA